MFADIRLTHSNADKFSVNCLSATNHAVRLDSFTPMVSADTSADTPHVDGLWPCGVSIKIHVRTTATTNRQHSTCCATRVVFSNNTEQHRRTRECSFVKIAYYVYALSLLYSTTCTV